MPEQSRFAVVSRRAFLAGASLAAVTGLVACTDDSSLRATATPTTGTTASPTKTPTASTATTASSASSAAVATGAPVPSGAAATIAFTYTAAASTSTSQGGRGGGGGGAVRNPYIAVWVEDAAGALVRTVSLWHLQGGNDRWLSELRRWYQVAGGDDTGSSATRVAGSYTVRWDGTGLTGAKVPAGGYVICLEASREHGPYSLIRQEVTLSAQAVTATLPANGELSAATLAWTV